MVSDCYCNDSFSSFCSLITASNIVDFILVTARSTAPSIAFSMAGLIKLLSTGPRARTKLSSVKDLIIISENDIGNFEIPLRSGREFCFSEFDCVTVS